MNKRIKLSGHQAEIHPYFIIVGTGGTGGYVAQQVAQLVSVYGKGSIILADADVVEEKNLKNQLFVKSDIGFKKASILAERYSAAYEVSIGSYTEKYIESIDDIEKLVSSDYLGIGYYKRFCPILIGCVDNKYSRRIFHEYFMRKSSLIYIDVGNESAKVPKDFIDRSMSEWSEEEVSQFHNSGFTGQAVVGVKIDDNTIYEPVASIFPDIFEGDELAPSALSCSELAASAPQKLITNRYAAMCVNTIVNEILATDTISIHKMAFHAQKGIISSQ